LGIWVYTLKQSYRAIYFEKLLFLGQSPKMLLNWSKSDLKIIEKKLKKEKGTLFTGGPAPTNRPGQQSQPGPRACASPPSSRARTPALFAVADRGRTRTSRGGYAAATAATPSAGRG